MLSSSALFGKWCIRPALAEIVPNRTLMIRSKAFLLCFVGPHDPTMQGFIELARPDQTLTDPVIETPTWDCQRANQLGWPPFTRQETVMVPNPRAWGSHAQLVLQLRDRLRAKARAGAGRTKASVGQRLGNCSGSPAFLGQRLDQLADLWIGAQVTQLANRSDHDPLGGASADPLDTHLHTLAVALHIYDDSLNDLADDLFPIGCGGGWGGPECGNVRRQAANRLPLGFRQQAWLVLDKAMILLLKLLLGRQFLFPGTFQRPGHEPMLRFDRLVLTSSPLDFIGGSFAPLLADESIEARACQMLALRFAVVSPALDTFICVKPGTTIIVMDGEPTATAG